MKREMTGLVDVVGLLREQLRDTVRLIGHVQYSQTHFRDRDSCIVDLLRNISLELWTLRERIERRAASANRRPSVIDTQSEPLLTGDDDGSLESLLNRFCRYARKTSERFRTAQQGNDPEAVVLLDRILSTANTSIWFLDVYSNAVWIKSPLSRLPKWKHVSALHQMAG